MKKITTKIFMFTLMCMLLWVQPIFADTSGKAGTNITWTLNEATGIVTFSGSGNMTTITWESYKPLFKEVVFNGNITHICDKAFDGCTNLEKITFVSSITSIGDYAFQNCTSLKEVRLPEKLVTIEPYAFYKCTNLEKLYISPSLYQIYANAFGFCQNLKDVYIEDLDAWFNVWMPESASPLSYNANLYVNGELLTEAVVTKESLEYFFPLKGCGSLKKVTFTNGSVIPDRFLQGCINLEEVVFRNSIWYIGKSSFAGCKSLEQITLPTATATIEDYAFSNCTGLKEIVLPDKVPIIDTGVFSGCTNLEKVHISSQTNAKRIYPKAFENCISLKEFTISDVVTRIDENAFAGCESLTSITIPAKVATIGNNPFDGCINLAEIKVAPENTNFCVGEDHALYNIGKTRLICIPPQKAGDSYTMPATLTSYDKNILYGMKSIIVDPQNQTFAGDEYGVLYSKDMKKLLVFPSDSEVSSYRLPDNLTIESGAFAGVKNLTELHIPLTTTVYQYAFTGIISKPTVYVFPGTQSETTAIACGFEVKNAGALTEDISWEFSDGCLTLSGTGEIPVLTKSAAKLPWYYVQNNIEKIVIEEGITGISKDAFSGLTNLKNVVIADSVKTIASRCFGSCSQLTTIDLGNGLETLGYAAFEKCTALESILLPSSVTSIDTSFYGCSSLKKINVADLDKFQSISSTSVFGSHSGVLYYNDEPVLHPVITQDDFKGIYYNAKFVESITYAEGVTANTYMSYIYATKVILPSTLESFSPSSHLKEIEIHPDNPYLCAQDNVVYDKEKTLLIFYPATKEDESFVIPNGINTIKANSFSNNKFIKEVIAPETLQHIKSKAFYYCSNLESITLSEGLLSIEENAFQYTNIKTLFIPQSVQDIKSLGIKPTIKGYYDSAAHQYAQQKSLIFIGVGVSSNTIDHGTFGEELSWRISNEHILYITGNGTMPDYASPSEAPWYKHMGWIERIIIEEGITSIGDNSFSDFSSKKQIIVLADITSVSKNAFAASPDLRVYGYAGNALESYALENDITYITILDFGFASQTVQWMYTADNHLIFIGSGFMGDWQRTQDTPWYSYKKSIVAVEIPEGITNIGGWSLSGCSALKTLVIPKSVEYIQDYSLNGCSSLEELTLPFIGRERGGEGKESSVFGSVFGFLGVGGSASLSGAIVQRFTENMDKDAYIGAFIPTTIKKVTITDESFIAYGAFYNCQFEEIVIPADITHISPYAFYNSAQKVTYPGTAKSWERLDVGHHNTININITGVDNTTPEPTISVIDVAGGKKISIQSEKDASVYYTLDGTLPNHHSNRYNGDFVLSEVGEYKINAIAILRGLDESYCVSENVSISKVNPPVACPESGIVAPGTPIYLQSDLEDSEIFYTLDDSDLSWESLPYENPIEINGFVKIRAIATKKGWADSDVAVYHYLHEYATPQVVTTEATLVSKNSAILHGEIQNKQDLSFYNAEFVYYPKNNPSNETVVKADDTLTLSAKNLLEDTQYCYYLKVTNGDKSSIGNTKEFRTKTYEIPLEVVVEPEGIRLQSGREYQLSTKVYPQTALNQQMLWKSSDERVAVVDENGVVKALAMGEAVITATAQDGGASANCKIVVYNKYVTETVDVSELNIATNTQYYAEYGFVHDKDQEGGHNNYVLSYFMRWDGPITEEKDKNLSPTATSQLGYKLENYYLEADADYHVQNAYILPIRENSLDNDEIKRAIKKYGAVTATMFVASDRNYGYGSHSYYYDIPWNWSVGNHLITLVGWDDDYPASNFFIQPEGNGAFIAKNSWGENYGDEGFFYISYYDAVLARYANSYVFPELETNTNYNNIWQYDYTGPSYKMGYQNSTYAANVFPQDGKALANDELLRAVSFHTVAQDMKYEVYIVDNYIDESSLIINSSPVKSGLIHEMGYHTIELDHYIPLKAGNRFAVIVRLISEDNSVANVLIEKLWSLNANMVRFDNVGFFSSNGTEWSEISTDANICIKAFTDFADVEKAQNHTYHQNETVDTEFTEVTSANADSSYKVAPYHFGGLYPDMMDTIMNDFVSDIELPKRYDLRELAQVTPSKDQGGFGLCWCFGAAGALESSVLKRIAEGALNGIDNNLPQSLPTASIQLSDGQLHINSSINATVYVAIYDDEWNFVSVQPFSVKAEEEKYIPFDENHNTQVFVWDNKLSALCKKFSYSCK